MASEAAHLHPTQLVDAWLSEARLVETPDFDLAGTNDLSYAVSTHTDAALGVQEPSRATARLHVAIDWRDSEGDEVAGPFSVSIVVTGDFVLQGPPPDEASLLSWQTAATEWLEFNALHLLWPYARAYIADLTTHSRYMPLTLYTMQAPRPRALDPDTSEFEAPHG